MQAQAYEGYFEKACQLSTAGRMVTIPKRCRVVITVFEEPPTQEITTADSNRIDKRLAIVRSLKGIIPKDIDLEAVRTERRATRGLTE